MLNMKFIMNTLAAKTKKKKGNSNEEYNSHVIKRSKQFIQRDEIFTGSEFKEIRVNSKYNGLY